MDVPYPLYAAADLVGNTPNLELVQLNSFGCGGPSGRSGKEILQGYGKMFTCLKIDEVNSRCGSYSFALLISVMDERNRHGYVAKSKYKGYKRQLFSPRNAEKHTILAPQMSPIHFELLESAFRESGYNIVI